MPESEQPPEQDRYRGLLGRMEHAVQQRTEAESGLNKEGIRLLDRAITALFEDCVDAGCKAELAENFVQKLNFFNPEQFCKDQIRNKTESAYG